VPIDDSLSLNQAIEEVKQLKDEIAKLNQRMEFEFKETEENLQKAYKKQIELTVVHLPPNPTEKDLFETTEEYQKRLLDYARKVEDAEIQRVRKIADLKAEESHKLKLANQDYIEQRVALLEPFVKRLQSLQGKTFSLPEERISVTLRPPDADRSHFPLELQYKDQKWTRFWGYTDRNKARDLWRTKAYLRAQGLFQIVEKETIQPRLTSCRVSHPGTGEIKDFILGEIPQFPEIKDWYDSLQLHQVIPDLAVGKIVHVRFDPAHLHGKPSLDGRVVGKAYRSTELKILEFKKAWLLVETPSGREGWIARKWLVVPEEKISRRFWDADKKKYYRYNALGNHVYE
jgi:hypothetical protein